MDLSTLADALQTSQAALLMKSEPWLYPFVNFAHILGIALLFGAILPLDLRLMGLWRSIPLAELKRILVPVSAFGLLVAVSTGVLMISVKASEYLAMPVMQAKLALIAIGILNALALRIVPAWRLLAQVDSRGTISRFRWAGFMSATIWIAVIGCGRAIGYL
ncbi:hypothetical protein HPQ64_04620 [Rhizobiales bacterium]|uniref:hypothetical protein n=1 Tax=Hongsoonwoonella zoysiae TaxID=2821844 RepID=UPI00155FC8D9|nr:hypothetical protein [Hongsoonwoonella zoysiae]NRG16964.1 hypothetical protein [Hongsoonwoonella zoysiae]